MGYVANVLLFLLGVFMVWKTELMWEFEHMFSVRGGEPTEFYLASMKVSGVILIFISVGILIASFIS